MVWFCLGFAIVSSEKKLKRLLATVSERPTLNLGRHTHRHTHSFEQQVHCTPGPHLLLTKRLKALQSKSTQAPAEHPKDKSYLWVRDYHYNVAYDGLTSQARQWYDLPRYYLEDKTEPPFFNFNKNNKKKTNTSKHKLTRGGHHWSFLRDVHSARRFGDNWCWCKRCSEATHGVNLIDCELWYHVLRVSQELTLKIYVTYEAKWLPLIEPMEN